MAEQNAMLTGRVVPEAALEGSVNMPQFVGGGGVTEEKDPTVPAWAKQPEKPTYTADEVGAISQDQLGNAVNQALLQAKETGEFDGAPGDDGLSPVAKVEQTSDGAVISITDKEGTTEATISNGKDGNPGVYIGSGDMPEGYNVQIDPNGDAFTPDDFITSPMVGATATAAGKAGLVPAPAAGDNGKFLRGDGTWGEIAIPEGGGGDSWRLVSRIILTEDATSIQITEDSDGNAFALKKFHIVCRLRGATGNTGYGYLFVQTMSNPSGVKDRILVLPSAVPASGGQKTCYCNAELCGESLAVRGASAVDGTSEATTYSFTLANTGHFQRASMLYNPISDITISASNSGYGANTMIDLWGVDA